MSDIKQQIISDLNKFPSSVHESVIMGEAIAIIEKHLEGMVIMPENLTPEIISDIKHSYGDFTDSYCESDIIDNHRLAVMTFKESK